MRDKQVDIAFDRLIPLIEGRQFRTRNRGPRSLSVSEFMFMGHRDGHDQFKHIVTRNYIFVKVDENKLIVPQSNQAFMLGFFDAA